MRTPITRTAAAVLAVSSLTAAPIAGATEPAPGMQTTGGLSVYLGVLPAAVVQGHPAAHTEAQMHGGVPAGRHAYHVIAAIFDEATGERIEDAEVVARVRPVGLATVTRPLEPMEIADTIAYGNYFQLAATGPFRIDLAIAYPPGSTPPQRRVHL